MALAEAEGQLSLDRERLNVLMGLWGTDTQWEVSSRLPDIPEQMMSIDSLERRAIETSLGLGAMRQQIKSTARFLGLTDATALIPVLETGVSSEREEGDWDAGPTIALPVPFFDRGQARLAAARSALRRARHLYWAQAVEIRAALRAAWQAAMNARRRTLHIANVVLPLRTQIVRETQLQYNAMQVSVFQLLLAKQQQINTALEYIGALRDYWLARTELEQILQGHSSGSELTDTPTFKAVDLSEIEVEVGGS